MQVMSKAQFNSKKFTSILSRIIQEKDQYEADMGYPPDVVILTKEEYETLEYNSCIGKQEEEGGEVAFIYGMEIIVE